MVLEVISPESTIFKGGVKAVSSINETGPFDLLPFHANFVTVIKQRLVIEPSRGRSQEIKVSRGVLYCYNNNVTVYLGI